MGWKRWLLAGWIVALAGCAGGGATAPTAPERPVSAEAAQAAPSSQEAGPRSLERVSLALPAPGGNYVPHYIAVQRGLFREEGLEVSLSSMRPSLLAPALAAGELDYHALVGVAIRNALAGVPERVVLVGTDKSTRHLMVTPGINSIEQLRGRAVAVPGIGSGPHLSAVLALEHFGMDPHADVTWLTVDAPLERMLVVQQGGAQASVFNGPEVPRARKLGLVTLLKLDEVAPIPEGGLTTSLQKLAEQRDQVKRMTRALVRALRFVKTDREGSLPYFMDFLAMSREEAEETYDAIADAFSPDGTISATRLRFVVELERKTLKLAEEVPLGRVADFGPLHDGLAELGIRPAPDAVR